MGRTWLVPVLIAPIRFYQRWISPGFPSTCRFYPSCSSYAVESLQLHGVLKGSYLAVRRLLKCAPWHPGGHDPVPPCVAPVTSRSLTQESSVA
ncbi:hypothetical protein BH20ACT5_BH20ACT5_22040 [soil metagenome]